MIANEPVKTVRKSALEPLHTRNKVGVFSLKAAIVVIGHDDIGEQSPTEPQASVDIAIESLLKT